MFAQFLVPTWGRRLLRALKRCRRQLDGTTDPFSRFKIRKRTGKGAGNARLLIGLEALGRQEEMTQSACSNTAGGMYRCIPAE